MAGLTGSEYDAQRRRWRTAYDAVCAAIADRSAETGEDRCALERAVQEAMRHTQEDPAVE
nr:hypothetical protein [Streptomyces sp. SID4982]